MIEQFDASEIALSPAAARLAHIYFGKLLEREDASRLPPYCLWYAAASAAECLQFAHEDAKALRVLSPDAVEQARAIGKIDSQFYLGLVDKWLAEWGEVTTQSGKRAVAG